jgi:hypothetical protein
MIIFSEVAEMKESKLEIREDDVDRRREKDERSEIERISFFSLRRNHRRYQRDWKF